MFSAAMHLLQIKDLKDLSIFYVRRCYRHAGPKGPEEMFSRMRSRGTGPRATGQEEVLSPCPVRERVLPNYSLLILSC